MEVRVEERLTGEELRARILAAHGSREDLEPEARRKGAYEAKDDLRTLRLLEADPTRLAEAMHAATSNASRLAGSACSRPSRASARPTSANSRAPSDATRRT